MATCGGNQDWSQQYGNAILSAVAPPQISAPQIPSGALAPQSYQPQKPVTPAAQGAFAAGPTPGAAAAAAATAPKTGALNQQPKPPALSGATPNQSVIDAYNGLDKDTKREYTELMDNKLDIPKTFQDLQSSGYITAPASDYSKQDMAGFIMEAGLRMAQAGARGDYYYNPWAAAATGILGATEGYRARQMQARQMAMQYNQIQYERALESAKFRQTAQIAELNRQSAERVAQTQAAGQAGRGSVAAAIDAKSAIERSQAAARSRGAPYFDSRLGGWFYPGDATHKAQPVIEFDPSTGQSSWRQDAPQGKPVAPKTPAQLGPEDIEKNLQDLREQYTKNGFIATIPDGKGGTVTWNNASISQQNDFLSAQADTMRQREAPRGSPAANPYAGMPGAKVPASAAAPAPQQAQNNAADTEQSDIEDEAKNAAREYENEQGGEN
jgi:hypothetical protein